MKRRMLLALGIGTAVCVGAASAQDTSRASEVLQLQGNALQAPRTLTPSALASQAPDRIASFTQSRGAPGAQTSSTVRGVRLGSLIEDADLTAAAKSGWRDVLVTVTATDGYRARFTWAELTNTPGGRGVLVLFERDGQPLDRSEGLIALLSTGDLRLGPRHVRNVEQIEVRVLLD